MAFQDTKCTRAGKYGKPTSSTSRFGFTAAPDRATVSELNTVSYFSVELSLLIVHRLFAKSYEQ